MVCLPGSTDPVTVAEQHMRNSDRPAGHVESPVPSNGHAGFGRRDEETDQSKDRHRASSRPHNEPEQDEILDEILGWIFDRTG